MSKKRSFRGKPKKTKAPNPGDMMAQLQQMQADMRSAQEALADEAITVSAGGGAINITITGHQRVQAIEVDPDLLDPDDVEMLQDLLVAGINQAIEQSQQMAAERMEGLTGGLGASDLLGGLM